MYRTKPICSDDPTRHLTVAGSAARSVPALYLADTVQTATAEWYRALAKWGLLPGGSRALRPPSLAP